MPRQALSHTQLKRGPLDRATRRLLTMFLGAVAFTVTCADSPATFEPCPGDTVTVQVAAGMTPFFTWLPACGVTFFMVYPSSGGSALWTVYADSGRGPENPIPSGVRYGVTPQHGRTVAGPQPLQSGTAYRIHVSRLLCDQGVLCTLHQAGSATFQP